MKLYHYTKASNLRLILQSKRFRFTRADQLDDVEDVSFKANHLSRNNVFISSWVKSDHEISGPWYRYADKHKGVCLSFENSPFPKEELNFCFSRPLVNSKGESKCLGFQANDVRTLFDKETMFGNGF